MGSLATGGAPLGSSDRIIGPINDPTFLVQGGLQYWTPSDGDKTEDYEVFRGSPSGNGGENPVFGKTNGLGDIESDCRLVFLPIELGSLVAYPIDDGIVLDWTTLSETNNAGFEIEWAAPGQNFQTKGWVSGAGTSATIQSYAFTIRDVFPGTNLVRLKQIDIDGSSSYTNAVEVEAIIPNGFVLQNAYPNPFNPSTNIKFAVEVSQDIAIDLFDAQGLHIETVFRGLARSGEVLEAKINGGDLPSGVYLVRMSGDGISAVKPITLTK